MPVLLGGTFDRRVLGEDDLAVRPVLGRLADSQREARTVEVDPYLPFIECSEAVRLSAVRVIGQGELAATVSTI